MITEMVTESQLASWKALYESQKHLLHPNRITGAALADYFLAHYKLSDAVPQDFAEVVRLIAMDEGEAEPDIVCGSLPDGVCVGIDRKSGTFHVECEEIAHAVPVWDDLFVRRGLTEEDLRSYVIVGQYLQLTAAHETTC